MLKRLLERLDTLDGAVTAIRGKAGDKKAPQLDGLALARTLLAVDAAVRKLSKLAEDLGPGGCGRAVSYQAS
jgi:hypothetical protein